MLFTTLPRRRFLSGAVALLVCVAAPARPAAVHAARQRPASARAARRQQPPAQVPADLRAALARISPDSLRGHLSFIASDALEGRDTPSRGLDLAAEYVAAQFRRAGLEPAGDDGYFQTANWSQSARDMGDFELKFKSGDKQTSIGRERVSLALFMGRPVASAGDAALALSDAGVVKVDYGDGSVGPEQSAGRVVLTELPDIRRADRARWREMFDAQAAFLAKAKAGGAALVISVDRAGEWGAGAGPPRLIDPEDRRDRQAGVGLPVIKIHGADAVGLYDSLPFGPTPATLSLRAPATVEKPVKVRNVAGLLRGSDPLLKDTYVLVTAHYDHLGTEPGGGDGDHVYNGANDDGSGTVSVVEIASALSTLRRRPRRSILFMTFFGEEKGLLGSRYYGRHPLVPLPQTVAQVNLEQVGRTDDSEGPQVATAAVTGFDYTDVGARLKAAGDLAGVKFYKHPQNSDAYFARSDNQALADVGVPAHTVGVAFEFPDYHGLGDHWEKVDYDNMAKVARAVALGVALIAGDPREPRWNEANPRTARYVEAWRTLHGN